MQVDTKNFDILFLEEKNKGRLKGIHTRVRYWDENYSHTNYREAIKKITACFI
jgi:hypothetical protein